MLKVNDVNINEDLDAYCISNHWLVPCTSSNMRKGSHWKASLLIIYALYQNGLVMWPMTTFGILICMWPSDRIFSMATGYQKW